MKNVKSKYVKTQFPSVLGYALCSKAQVTSLGQRSKLILLLIFEEKKLEKLYIIEGSSYFPIYCFGSGQTTNFSFKSHILYLLGFKHKNYLFFHLFSESMLYE